MLRFVVLVFAMACVGCGAAALYLPNWYGFTLAGVYKYEYGLWKQCITTPTSSTCDDIKFVDVNFSECTRTGDEMQLYIYSMVATGAFGGLMCLLAMGFSLCGSKGISVLRVVLTLLGMLGNVASVSLAYYFFENYYYCGLNACELYAKLITTDCEITRGISFWLMTGSAGGGLLCFVLALVVCGTHPGDDDEAAEDGASAKDGASANEPTADHAESGVAPAAEKSATGDEAGEEEAEDDDDWVYEEESGYYWSDNAQLYKHEESGQFYDPESGMWYDPESEEWYEPDEEEYDE
jgi:hypothetical protein